MKIENAHEVGYEKKIIFIMCLLALYVQLLRGQNRYGFVWAVVISPRKLPIKMTKL